MTDKRYRANEIPKEATWNKYESVTNSAQIGGKPQTGNDPMLEVAKQLERIRAELRQGTPVGTIDILYLQHYGNKEDRGLVASTMPAILDDLHTQEPSE